MSSKKVAIWVLSTVGASLVGVGAHVLTTLWDAPDQGTLTVSLIERNSESAESAWCRIVDHSEWNTKREAKSQRACVWDPLPRGRYEIEVWAQSHVFVPSEGSATAAGKAVHFLRKAIGLADREFWGRVAVKVPEPGKAEFVRQTPAIESVEVDADGVATARLVNPTGSATVRLICEWGKNLTKSAEGWVFGAAMVQQDESGVAKCGFIRVEEPEGVLLGFVLQQRMEFGHWQTVDTRVEPLA